MNLEQLWAECFIQYSKSTEWDDRAHRIAVAANDRFGPGLDWWPVVYQRLWRHAVAKSRQYWTAGQRLEDQARSLDF